MSNSSLPSDLAAGGADEDLIGIGGASWSCSQLLCWLLSSSSGGGIGKTSNRGDGGKKFGVGEDGSS